MKKLIVVVAALALLSTVAEARSRHGTYRTRSHVSRTTKPEPHLETGVPSIDTGNEIAKLTPDLIRAYVAKRISQGEYIQ